MSGKHVLALATASLVWLATAASLAAQTPGGDIVIVGRNAEQTQRFVEQLSVAPTNADQLARWDTSICTSIAGLPQRQGQFLADQIARRAGEVGLAPGAPGCTPNVAVFVTADANAMARRMFEQDRQLFGYRADSGVSTLGETALQDFLNTDRPVRWWHVQEAISADGFSLRGDASSGGISNAPTLRSSGTRLRSEIRQDFARVVVIVDARRVGEAQLSALADYIAMVSLAPINPQVEAREFPTILNLFASAPGSGRATELSDWDRAFLSGLYRSNRNAANVQQQQRDIARTMEGGS